MYPLLRSVVVGPSGRVQRVQSEHASEDAGVGLLTRTSRCSRRYRPGPGTDVRGLGVLIAAGDGLAVLPLAVATDLPGTVAVRISELRLVHRIEMPHPKQPSEPVRTLAIELGG